MNASVAGAGWPRTGDFAGPPDAATVRRWTEADRVARPARVERVRGRLAEEGLDAYFGTRPEHMRYLLGFGLANGEEKVAGHSGQFLIGRSEVIVLADTRY